MEMLSACLALYFGQLSYNPGKVGWFGNLGRGQSSDNPRKVGWFGFIEGLYDVVPNFEIWELGKEMDKDGRVVFGLGG